MLLSFVGGYTYRMWRF